MAKAINWPQEFYDEIMSEDMNSQRAALRLGSIYYDNGYFTPNEIIDIRINSKITRKAQIIGGMKLSKIKELSENDISRYKKSLQSKAEIIKFLSENYKQDVTEDSTVTVITYRNLDLILPDDDDPHM